MAVVDLTAIAFSVAYAAYLLELICDVLLAVLSMFVLRITVKCSVIHLNLRVTVLDDKVLVAVCSLLGSNSDPKFKTDSDSEKIADMTLGTYQSWRSTAMAVLKAVTTHLNDL